MGDRMKKFMHFTKIDSTNTYLKSIADTADDGTIVWADEQTNGRGRLNRSWTSKNGAGALFSVLVKRRVRAENAVGLVFAAALAAVKALEKITDCTNFKIKWPNDLVLNGKKLCGIICEMEADGMNLSWAVIGIGINLKKQPKTENTQQATSIEEALGINTDALSVITTFSGYFNDCLKAWENGELNKIIDEIKPYSATIGQRVKVITGETEYEGEAIDISPTGELKVKINDEIKTVCYGDVSVRGIMGYA